MGLASKDLLGLKQLTAEEIMEILDTAKMMKMVLTSGNKKTSHLQGKSVVTLFYETNSTESWSNGVEIMNNSSNSKTP